MLRLENQGKIVLFILEVLRQGLRHYMRCYLNQYACHGLYTDISAIVTWPSLVFDNPGNWTLYLIHGVSFCISCLGNISYQLIFTCVLHFCVICFFFQWMNQKGFNQCFNPLHHVFVWWRPEIARAE